jgi:hypothetical protein
VLGVSILPLSTILIFYLGIVPTVCYFLLVLFYDYFVLAFMFQSKHALVFKAL